MRDQLFRRLTPDFYVAPQLEADDFERARALGIATIVNNRPDGEAADQLAHTEAQEIATAAGMTYVHVPVVSGRLQQSDVEAMRRAIDGHDGPFLAYCRSGTRSCQLWALAVAPDMPSDAIVRAAAGAGYDLDPLRPLLDDNRAGRR